MAAQFLVQNEKKLIISDETAEQIKMTFQGVFSVVKVGTTLLKTLGRIGVKASNAAIKQAISSKGLFSLILIPSPKFLRACHKLQVRL